MYYCTSAYEAFLQALEEVENDLEDDREMETRAQKQAVTEEADREMKTGAQKQAQIEKQADREMETGAQKQAQIEKEADREMEIGAQNQAETDKEADREIETGAQKQPKEAHKCRALKNPQHPPAKRCTRHNTKLPDWNKIKKKMANTGKHK